MFLTLEADCVEPDSKDKGVTNPESDPWLAALRYQASTKALETVESQVSVKRDLYREPEVRINVKRDLYSR